MRFTESVNSHLARKASARRATQHASLLEQATTML